MKRVKCWFFQKPEALFGFIAFFFGLTLIFLNPPLRSPDEVGHFVRAYQLATEGFKTVSDASLSVAMEASVAQGFRTWADKLPSHTGRHERLKYTPDDVLANLNAQSDAPLTNVPIALLKTQAIVFPLAYVPQALVIHAGLHFGQSFLALLYEARLLNLLFCLGITLAAMRIMPFGKEVLAAVSLLPMAVFERSQISTDGLVMASAALVVAVTLRLYDQQKQEPMKGRYGLYVLACAGLLGLAVCKSTYLSIFMLWALLLKRNKKMALVGGALIFPALLLSSWWGHFLSLHDYRILDAGRAGILDPTGKIELLIHAPVDIALRVLRTMARYSYWLGQIIGLFGQTDVPLAWPFRSLGIVWLAGVAWVSAPPNRHFEKWERCLLIGSFWIQAVLIILTIFLIWADPAAPIIEGVQGRYFLPILPGLLVGLSEIVPKWKRHITREQMRAFTFLPACFLLGCAALTIALREWAL